MNDKSKSFKQVCKERGVNYWRALKRRNAGLPEEKIFEKNFVRQRRETIAVTVHGKTYPNLREAIRELKPPASPKSIARWMEKGLSAEDAFSRTPNPGYEKGIVYLITHIETGKQYVGITIQSIERRWKNHTEQAKAGSLKSDASLHEAIRRYGADAFKVSIIDHGSTKRGLEKAERDWIKQLNSLEPNGFNISPGGTSGGSTPIATVVDGEQFKSVKDAAKYVADTRNISIHAAKRRLLKKKIDVRTPAKPGHSLVRTPAYKSWSRIVHGVLNKKSKEFIEGVSLYEPWNDFDAFYKDVGQPKEPGMVFARINKRLGFSPSNCRWMTKSEASRINAAHMKEEGRLVGRRGHTKFKS